MLLLIKQTSYCLFLLIVNCFSSDIDQCKMNGDNVKGRLRSQLIRNSLLTCAKFILVLL